MTEPHPTDGEIIPVPSDPPAPSGEPATFVDLFFRPTRFFSSALPYSVGDALLAIAWVAGMNATIGRIERQMIRSDLGGDAPPMVAGSWIAFWLVTLIVGAIWGPFIWYLGGWWYRVRLRWCGAAMVDAAKARTVYLFALLVWAAPAIFSQAVDTLRFPDYQASWDDESWWPILVAIFPFWSVIVSYRGVRAAFEVRSAPTRFWFLAAPIAIYLAVTGIIAALYMQAE